MKLELLRINSGIDATSGILFQKHPEGDKTFLCYTLEDQAQEKKVYAETRIPAGIYDIRFRTVGGFTTRYLKKYGAGFHKGMLELHNKGQESVVGSGDMTFKYVLIHKGNSSDPHSAGCILLGDSQDNNDIKLEGWIGHSGQAYERVYPIIRDALLGGASVEIEIIDYEEGNYSSQKDTTAKDIKAVVGGVYCNKCNTKFKTQII
jgi:hypothetical protein